MSARRMTALFAVALVALLAACAGPRRVAPARPDGGDADVQRAVAAATEALLEPELRADLPAFELPEPVDPLPLPEGSGPAAVTAEEQDDWEAASHGAPVVPAAPDAPAYEPLFLLPAPVEHVEDGPSLEAFSARDAQVRDVLALLFAHGELGFLLSGDVSGLVSFDMHATSRAEALLELLRHVRLSMDVAGGHVIVSDRARRRVELPQGTGLSVSALITQVAPLLEGAGYVVPFSDGWVEVESTPQALERVLATLDGLPRTPTGNTLRLRSTATRLGPTPLPLDGRGLGRQELATVMAWQALEHALARRPASAAVWRDDALSLDATSSWAHLADGLLSLQAGASGAALPGLERAATARPDDPLAQTARALVDVAEGRDDDAVAHFANIHSQWPGPVHALNLANALMLAGRPDEALDVARRADDGLPELHVLRAWLFARAEWREAALGEIAAALRSGARGDDPGLVAAQRCVDGLQVREAERREEEALGIRAEFEPGWH